MRSTHPNTKPENRWIPECWCVREARIGDLCKSGSVEQDADLVALLFREESAEGKATLIIAKQRNGPVGDVKLTFLKEFTRFETRADEAHEEE